MRSKVDQGLWCHMVLQDSEVSMFLKCLIWLIVAYWRHMVTEIWVNIGSGNGLLPDGTKPLPEPILTDHQWSPVTFILGQYHKRCLNHQSLKSENCMSKILFKFPSGQWVNYLEMLWGYYYLSRYIEKTRRLSKPTSRISRQESRT